MVGVRCLAAPSACAWIPLSWPDARITGIFFERRAGRVFQCPFAGIFQPFQGVLVCQPQQIHAGLVALLLYFVAAENGLDSDLRVAADFTDPVNEPFTVPLDILLVLWRHMLLECTVLVKSAVQPEKGTDAVSTVEDPHSGSGEPDIYFLIDVLKGNRIVHTLHRNVVGSFRFRAMLIGIGENWHTTFFYYYEYMRYVNNGISL